MGGPTISSASLPEAPGSLVEVEPEDGMEYLGVPWRSCLRSLTNAGSSKTEIYKLMYAIVCVQKRVHTIKSKDLKLNYRKFGSFSWGQPRITDHWWSPGPDH